MTILWILVAAEALACAALWLPGPAFERFRRTPVGRIMDRAWFSLRWPTFWRRS